MSISPLAAVTMLGAARALVHDLVSLPKILRGSNTSHYIPTGYAAKGNTAGTPRIPEASRPVTASAPSTLYGVSTVQDARQMQARLATFSAELGKVFAEHGISTMPEVVLRTDAVGRVVVANDHPEAGRIEAFFERNPVLSSQFQQLSEAMQAIQQARTGQLRTTNPKQPFHLVMGAEGVRVFYGSDPS